MSQAQSINLRFANTPSQFETTHRRLKDLAEFFGVSQNKAAAYAINRIWEMLSEDGELQHTLAHKRQGVRVGRVSYLNADEDHLQRIRERLAAGVPLPHEDDESLDRHPLLLLLPQDQQDAVRREKDPMAKRRLMAELFKQAEQQA